MDNPVKLYKTFAYAITTICSLTGTPFHFHYSFIVETYKY